MRAAILFTLLTCVNCSGSNQEPALNPDNTLKRLTNIVYSQVGPFCKSVPSVLIERIPFDEQFYIRTLKRYLSEFFKQHNLPLDCVNCSAVHFGPFKGEASFRKNSITVQSFNSYNLYAVTMHEYGHIAERNYRTHFSTELWSQLFQFYAFRNLYLAGKADVASLVCRRFEGSFVFFNHHYFHNNLPEILSSFLNFLLGFNRLAKVRRTYSKNLIQALYILAEADGDFDRALDGLKNVDRWSDETCLEKAQHVSEYLDKIFPETEHCSGKDWAERLKNLSNSSDAEAYETFDFKSAISTHDRPSCFRGFCYKIGKAFLRKNLLAQIGSIICALSPQALDIYNFPIPMKFLIMYLGTSFLDNDFWYKNFVQIKRGLQIGGIICLIQYLDKVSCSDFEISTQSKFPLLKLLHFYKKHKSCFETGVTAFFFGNMRERHPLTLATMAISSMLSTKILEAKL